MRILYAATLLLTAYTATAQTLQTTFGQHRMQYERNDWRQYESEHFITYWYADDAFGERVVRLLEQDFQDVRSILEHRLAEKIEVIVYNDLQDLQQSNFELPRPILNTGGRTKTLEEKMYVYYDGSYADLRRQLREGITEVYLKNMFFGSNFQEIVQNAVLLNLPDWFTEGLIAYMGSPWAVQADDRMRDYLASNENPSFEELARRDARFAGRSMWYFIESEYGENTVSNMLYLTRINRSVEDGVLYMLGTSYSKVKRKWLKFFKKRYARDARFAGDIPGNLLELNSTLEHSARPAIRPDGRQVAYVDYRTSSYRVKLLDIGPDVATRTLLSGGERRAFEGLEHPYPLLAWHPDNRELMIATLDDNQVRLTRYNINDNKKRNYLLPEYIEQVKSIAYYSSSRAVIIATRGGQSDLYFYDFSNKSLKAITKDAYDELDVAVIDYNDHKYIAFTSTRGVDSEAIAMALPDLYLMKASSGDAAIRLTNTPLIAERHPAMADSVALVYLSDKNGIVNRYTADLSEEVLYYRRLVRFSDGTERYYEPEDSISVDAALIDTILQEPVYGTVATTQAVTNYPSSIVAHSVASRTGRVVDMVRMDGALRLYYHALNTGDAYNPMNTGYRQLSMRNIDRDLLESLTNEASTTPTDAPQVDTTAATPESSPPDTASTSGFVSPFEEPAPSPRDTLPEPEVEVDIDNYQFQSEFEDEPAGAVIVEDDRGNLTLQKPKQRARPEAEPFEFDPSAVQDYRTQYGLSAFAVQFDNTLLFDGLETYSGFDYERPRIGVRLEAELTDLLENKSIVAGVRLPVSLNGLEAWATYTDRAPLIDRSFTYYRRSYRESLETSTGTFTSRSANMRYVIDQVQSTWSYPLSEAVALELTTRVRGDNRIFLATDAATLDRENELEQRATFDFGLTYDNTQERRLNLPTGFRARFNTALTKGFTLEFEDELQAGIDEGFMTTLQMDARYYLPVLRHSILAGRAAAGTSFGVERNLYYLGGVDNSLFHDFNDEIPRPDPATEDVAFHTLVSPMRGFNTNIRNGSNYVFTNVELRIPIARYFTRRRPSSAFLQNLQLVGFFDAGTAWTGPSPFDNDNPLNSVVIANPPEPVSVTVIYFRDPIVMSYGAGVRFMLFGYFARLDWAQGFETGVPEDPVWHFAIGKDF